MSTPITVGGSLNMDFVVPGGKGANQAVTRHGAQASIPTRAEVDAFVTR